MSSLFFFALPLVLCALPELRAERFSCAGHMPSHIAPGSAAKLAGGREEKRSSTEPVHALVIFARFADEEASGSNIPEFADDLFKADLPGSFAHFYRTMSGGQFTATGTVLPQRYSSQQPAAAYQIQEPGRDGLYGQFVQEILAQVDRGVDFGLFDNDGPDGLPNSGDDDGVVDYIFVNVRSTPHGFLRGGATGKGNLGFALYEAADRRPDGTPIYVNGTTDHGAIQREGSFAQTVGSMAHEFGHSLGLPDLYDLGYDNPAEDSAGIGHWGLMGWGAHGWNGDDGPVAFCAWSLEQLGWIGRDNDRLVEANRDTVGLVVEDLLQGGLVYRIPLRIQDGGRAWLDEEYLLLEQRSRASSFYRRSVPAEGLLVWHVRSQAQTNIDERRKAVDLICADGLYRDAGYPEGALADGLHGRDNLDFWAHDAAYNQTHNGNLGDATDPFDGVRFARLDMHSNPSTDPLGLIPAASSGLNLRLRRQSTAMVVDIAQPRWAGAIRDEVHWAGPVIVEGDLQVAPGGRLVVHESTQVLFAGVDQLRSGRDPERIELEIQGDLVVGDPIFRSAHQRREVVFKALYPGETWYGIRLDPADSSYIEMPEGSYKLLDVERGFLFAGAPSGGVPELKVNRTYRLVDVLSLETAGNGNGRLDAGESFQLAIDVSNWSLATYPKAQVSIEWPASRVYPTWIAGTALQPPFTLPQFSLVPGSERRFVTPSLTLSPEVQAGQEIEFSVRLDVGAWVRRDQLSFTVAKDYALREAEFEVPGRAIYNGSVWAPVAQPIPIRVLTRNEVEAVELVVRSGSGLEPLDQLALERRPDLGEKQVFEGTLQLSAAGPHRIFPRIHSTDGAVAFGDSSLYVWAAPFAVQPPVLVFIGDQYEEQERAAVRREMEAVLQDLGLQAHFLDLDWEQGARYRDLLPHYAGAGKLVVWLGEVLDEAAQAAFGQFMESGGRLFIASAELQKSPNAGQFLRHMLHSREGNWLRQGLVRSLYADTAVEFETLYAPLEPVAPAEPILMGRLWGLAAGLRLDNGVYRLTYLPFDLRGLEASVHRTLIESSLAFLHKPLEAALEIPGFEKSGQALIVAPAQATPVRARVAPAVQAATLVIRSIPELEVVAELPMRRIDQQAGEAVFEASFLPAAHSRYHLSLALQTEDGERSFAASSLWVLSLSTEPPVLLLVGKHHGHSTQEAVQRALGAGLEATVVDLGAGDEVYYEALLDHYLEEGELVIWMDGTLSERAQQAFRRFAAGGGRLVMASRKLPVSPRAGNFLRDVLHLGESRSASARKIFGVGSLEGPLFEFSADHASLELLAPAVPMLMNAAGQTAGLGVDNGTFRLVYWPFNLWQLNGAMVERLVEASLPFLRQGPAYETVLEVPDPEMMGTAILLNPGRGNAIGARVRGEAEAAALVVRLYPEMELVADLPMTLRSRQGDEREFEVLFQPPAPEQYQLSLRLYDAAGRAHLSAAHLRVAGMRFSTWRPVLVFLHEDIKAEHREPLLADLNAALQAQGLEADIVTRAPAEQDLYEYLLGHYLDDGDLVLWVGRNLDQEAQSVFQHFAEGGGRLLMASLDFRSSPGFRKFMRSVFHASIQKRSRTDSGFSSPLWPESRPIFLRYRAVDPIVNLGSTIEPVLLDREDRALGLKMDTGARRGVFLSFELKNLESAARRELLGANIAFLHERLEDTAVRAEGIRPFEFELLPNYPNPFNPQTTISYQLPGSGRVQLSIYNTTGQRIRRLVDEVQSAGFYRISWNGMDETGDEVGSGVYFYRLRVGEFAGTRRLLLLK